MITLETAWYGVLSIGTVEVDMVRSDSGGQVSEVSGVVVGKW